MGVELEVSTGTSGSLLDQPSEFIESRNADEAIVTGHSTLFATVSYLLCLFHRKRHAQASLVHFLVSAVPKGNTIFQGPKADEAAAWNAG